MPDGKDYTLVELEAFEDHASKTMADFAQKCKDAAAAAAAIKDKVDDKMENKMMMEEEKKDDMMDPMMGDPPAEGS